MYNVIKSTERGITRNQWLISRHAFSFGNYFDQKRSNFGNLIVFNDDIIKGGSGFGTHPHSNAEIVTIVLKGALKHSDSLGNLGTISLGEIQRMSAGKGILHSEFNASQIDDCHFLQIWLESNLKDIAPQYEQKKINPLIDKNMFSVIIEGSKQKQKENKQETLLINQDATFLIGEFEKEKTLIHSIKENKKIFLFVISGKLLFNDLSIQDGDSIEISDEQSFQIKTFQETKLLLIEL